MAEPSEGLRQFSLWQGVKKYRTILIAVTFWLIIIFSSRQYMQANDLSFFDLAEQLADFLRDSWYGPVFYVLAYLIRPLVLFPGTLITILGGSIFGFWTGAILVLFAGTASSIIPYALGRWFSASQDHSSDTESRVQRFVKMLQDNPFQAVLTMRLLYLPYDAVSLLAGSLKISFWSFFLATALGNLPGIVLFVSIGASIEGDLSTGDLSLNPTMLVFSVFILIASLGLSRLVNRFQKNKLSVTEAEDIQ